MKLGTGWRLRAGWLFVLVVAVALLLRLYMLDVRALHHDEGVHAYFVFKLLSGTPYVYNPTYHGPFLYYTQALVFSALDVSAFSLRLLPALFGAGCVALVYPLRRYMGDAGALLSAALLALSPSMLYYSRFLRNDIYLVFFTLAGFVLFLRLCDAKSRLGYVLISLALGSTLALMACTKENAYVLLLILALSVLASFLLGSLPKRRLSKGGFSLVEGVQRMGGVQRTERVQKAALSAVLTGASFAVVFVVFYSSFLTDLSQAVNAVPSAFEHWMHMHEIKRISGPWYYYLPILTIYETPILVLGLFGGVLAAARRDRLWVGVLVWALLSLVFYSYMQEKVPWLGVHIILPLVLLSGYTFSALLMRVKELPERKRVLTLAIFGLVLVLFCTTSLNTNYTKMNMSKGITYIQPPDSFADTMETIEQLHAENPDLTVLICARHNDYWPIPWYVRDMDTGYISSFPSSLDYDVVIVEKSLYHESKDTDEYERVEFELRPLKRMVAMYRVGLG
ncbi:MAG: flippase activity-associated protein Agl23 [Methermicoccaceae archaeon]